MAYTDIDDPSAYFQTALYTGDGNAQTITNDGNSDLQPDWVWIAMRSHADNKIWYDSVRGVTKRLVSNLSSAEATVSDMVTAFNSDGFSVGTNSNVTGDGKTFVGWQWKAGTSFTNDASSTGIGTIDSTGSVNTDAGFSIVSYSGNSTAGATIAHGLGATPKMMIVRKRNSAENWLVYHASTGNTGATLLNGTNAFFQDNMWNSTSPTSSVFTVHGDDGANGSGGNYIAYCFSEKKGYSKFGSYTGNGNADGTFVYTGFKVGWLMIKKTSGTSNWTIWDSVRQSNEINKPLWGDLNSAEAAQSTVKLDLLSNGFKIRGNGSNVGSSGGSYIYMAFASNPLVTSTGVPATAR